MSLAVYANRPTASVACAGTKQRCVWGGGGWLNVKICIPPCSPMQTQSPLKRALSGGVLCKEGGCCVRCRRVYSSEGA